MTDNSVTANNDASGSSQGKRDINSVFKRRAMYPVSEDPWVEVLVKNNSLLLPEAPMSFHLSEVVRISGIAPGYSTLELKNGDEHIFKLPHAELSDRIYAGDTSVIDLKDVSFMQSKKMLMQNLMKEAVQAGRISGPVWEVGESVSGEGVYLGWYQPKDRSGKSLGMIFNVFAAPQDLGGNGTYETQVNAVAALRNWHGHDGEHYADSDKILEALESGKYNGGWIIPPREVLMAGQDDAMSDNLYGSRKKGAFAGTFSMASRTNGYWYWASTREIPGSDNVWIQSFNDEGEGKFYSKTGTTLEARPVRLVPAL